MQHPCCIHSPKDPAKPFRKPRSAKPLMYFRTKYTTMRSLYHSY